MQQRTDAFGESSAVAGLSATSDDDDIGYTTLGIRAATSLPVAGAMVTPSASLAWLHAVGDLTPEQTFRFASTGTGFGIAGVPLAQNRALIEAGIDITLSVDAVLGVSYSGRIAGDVEDRGIQGSLTWRF